MAWRGVRITLSGGPRPSVAGLTLEVGPPRGKPIGSSATARSSIHPVARATLLPGPRPMLAGPKFVESMPTEGPLDRHDRVV